jgi:hypothetical protein
LAAPGAVWRGQGEEGPGDGGFRVVGHVEVELREWDRLAASFHGGSSLRAKCKMWPARASVDSSKSNSKSFV